MSTNTNQNREGTRVPMRNSTVNSAMERLQKVRKFKHDSEMHLKTRPSSSNLPSIPENHESSDHCRVLKGEKFRIPSVPDFSKEKRSCSEPPQRPIPDVPKTAEFAYFKKFKEEMGSNCRDKIKIADESDQNSEEKDQPSCHYSFPSPPRRDEAREGECAGELNSKGDEYAGRGVAQRNKSRQLRVANSYPEVGEGCSQRFDSVSGPGNRLFPQSYKFECSSSEERKINITDHLASSRNPYNEENISSMRNTSKLNHTSLYPNDFPEHWLDNPRKRVISTCLNSEERKIDDYYQLEAPRKPYTEEDIGTYNFQCFFDDGSPENWLERPRKRDFSKWDVADVSPHTTEHNAGISSRVEEMDSFCSFPVYQHDSPRDVVVSKGKGIDCSSFPSASQYAGISSRVEEMDWCCSFPEYQHESPRNRVISKWDSIANSSSPSASQYAGISSRVDEMDWCCSFPEYQHESPRNRVISKWNSIVSSTSPSAEYYAGISSQMNPFYGFIDEAFKNDVLETDLFCYGGFDVHQYIRPEHDLVRMDRARDSSSENHPLLLGWDTNQDNDLYTGSQQTWDNEDDPCSRFLPDKVFFEEDYASRSRILELPSNIL